MESGAKPQAAADYDRAVDRIRDEMAKDGSRYAQVVGDYLTGWLQSHPEGAWAILAEGRTIKGSLDAMKEAARKVSSGGVGILDDETAFGIVLEYYGLGGGKPAAARTESAAAEPDGLSLDALLAGVG